MMDIPDARTMKCVRCGNARDDAGLMKPGKVLECLTCLAYEVYELGGLR